MIIWKLEGQDYVLDDGSITLFHGHDGMGLAPIRRLEERGPLQHGVTDRGYRYDPRTIILTLGIKGKDLEDFYEKREQLVKLFSARNKPGKLRVVIGNRIREIKAHAISDSLQFSDSNREYLYQRAAVALKCPDPFWYDPNQKIKYYLADSGSETGFVPSQIPMTVGTSVLDITNSINYEGSVRSFPIITIQGPIVNPVIEHTQTGLKLDLTGTSLGAGEFYEINLEYGEKSITDQDGNRVSPGVLSNDSDIAQFAILPSGELYGGINTIKVTGNNVSTETKILISYYTRYGGI